MTERHLDGERAGTATAAFTVQDFQAKWRGAALTERAAAQSHFIDLCRALGVPAPTDADPTGSFYAFERGAEKAGGGKGWADVWFRGHFAWEYKKKHADLHAAYRQLRQYVEALEIPPPTGRFADAGQQAREAGLARWRGWRPAARRTSGSDWTPSAG